MREKSKKSKLVSITSYKMEFLKDGFTVVQMT